MRNLPGAIGAAIRHFWVVRGDQGQRQGERTGAKDTGNRALVTGGKQMTGFVDLFTRLIELSLFNFAASLQGRIRTTVKRLQR